MTTSPVLSIKLAAAISANIKSTQTTTVNTHGARVKITSRGIEYDRRFVVVGKNNIFVAQRSSLGRGIGVPQMCLVSSTIEDDTLIVRAPDMTDLCVSLHIQSPIENVDVWGNASLDSIYMGREAEQWFTTFLSRFKPGSYRLFRMTDTCRRSSKGGEALVANQDGFPFTIGSTASLDHLNARLRAIGETEVGWDRFRPSLILEGDPEAHFEDDLASIEINGVQLIGKTLCSRCPIVNTDQSSGTTVREPLKLLSSYRKGMHLLAPLHKVPLQKLDMVFFTRNFDHLNCGELVIGSDVRVVKWD